MAICAWQLFRPWCFSSGDSNSYYENSPNLKIYSKTPPALGWISLILGLHLIIWFFELLTWAISIFQTPNAVLIYRHSTILMASSEIYVVYLLLSLRIRKVPEAVIPYVPQFSAVPCHQPLRQNSACHAVLLLVNLLPYLPNSWWPWRN